jgi:hypothetical protein
MEHDVEYDAGEADRNIVAASADAAAVHNADCCLACTAISISYIFCLANPSNFYNLSKTKFYVSYHLHNLDYCHVFSSSNLNFQVCLPIQYFLQPQRCQPLFLRVQNLQEHLPRHQKLFFLSQGQAEEEEDFSLKAIQSQIQKYLKKIQLKNSLKNPLK